jgi:hypothetical protein
MYADRDLARPSFQVLVLTSRQIGAEVTSVGVNRLLLYAWLVASRMNLPFRLTHLRVGDRTTLSLAAASAPVRQPNK